MAKVTLDNISNLDNTVSAGSVLNTNFDRIEAAVEKTLSRDGTAPNAMEATLDMNNNRIINLPLPIHAHEPARKQELTDLMLANNAGTTDHGLLTGLGDDDHTHYYNSSRGKAAFLQAKGNTVMLIDYYDEANGAVIDAGIETVIINSRSEGGDIGGGIFKTVGSAPVGGLYFTDSSSRIWAPADTTYTPEMFGAKGDGTTDDTTAFQNAINAATAVSGRALSLTPNRTYITGALTSPAGLTMIGDNSKIKQASAITSPHLWVKGSNATIVGVIFEGPGVSAPTLISNQYTDGNSGLAIYSEPTGGTTPFTTLSGIILKDVRVQSYRDVGVEALYVNDLTTQNLTIVNCVLSGFTAQSCVRHRHYSYRCNNIYRHIYSATTAVNADSLAYGMSYSRVWYGSSPLSEANSPRSADIVVVGGVFTNIEYCGFDSHGAKNIVISGCEFSNVQVPINFEHGSSVATGSFYCSTDNASIVGCRFFGVDNTTQNRGPAILVDAQSGNGEIAKNIVVTGCTFSGFGHSNASGSPRYAAPAQTPPVSLGGAIYFASVDGLTFGNLTLTDVDSIAFCAGNNITNAVISDCTVNNVNTYASLINFLYIIGTSVELSVTDNSYNATTGSAIAIQTTPFASGYGLRLGTMLKKQSIPMFSSSAAALACLPLHQYRTWQIFNTDNTASSALTGSTTDTTMHTVSIPSYLMGYNGALQVRLSMSATGTAGTKTIRVKFGGTTFNAYAMASSDVSSVFEAVIRNRGSLSSQIARPSITGSYGSTSASATTGTVNTAVDQSLIVSGQLANAADGLVLETIEVSILTDF